MGWIDCLWVAVGIVALMTLIGLYLGFLTNWLSHKSSWTSRIKFEQWLDLYYLNPEEWRLEDTPNRYIYRSRRVYGGGYGNSYWAYVHFSFLDYLRYQLWKRSAMRREDNAKRDKRLKDVLELAQSDIERLKAQADWEMEEAKRRVEETKTRISMTTTHTTFGGSGLPTSEEISHATTPWFL